MHNIELKIMEQLDGVAFGSIFYPMSDVDKASGIVLWQQPSSHKKIFWKLSEI